VQRTQPTHLRLRANSAGLSYDLRWGLRQKKINELQRQRNRKSPRLGLALHEGTS